MTLAFAFASVCKLVAKAAIVDILVAAVTLESAKTAAEALTAAATPLAPIGAVMFLTGIITEKPMNVFANPGKRLVVLIPQEVMTFSAHMLMLLELIVKGALVTP